MKKYLVLFALIIIQGCSSGGGDSTTPADPIDVFPLFATGQFTAGYTDTINLTGSNTVGETFTGMISVQTQPESTFLGIPAIPLFTELQFTETTTGAFISNRRVDYYTTLATDRNYLGYIDSNVAIVSAVTEAIPQTAKIGDAGVVGTYTDNAGNVDTRSWRLDDAGGGFANRVELSTVTDQMGDVTESSVSTTKIDVNGIVQSYELVIFNASTNVTATLIGN